MNAQDALNLARRFIGLPAEKRRMFLDVLGQEGIDFSLLPIPAGVDSPERDGLSYAQRRMWFLWKLAPDSGAYNLPGAVRLHGALDENALAQAFAALVERHQVLRTGFVEEGGQVRQQVRPPFQPAIRREDLSRQPEAEREARVARLAEDEARAPFDLVGGDLLRIVLVRLGEAEHVLLLTLHHIVSDGWSMNVLIDEFTHFYDAFALGEAPGLPALPVQYADYALWQRCWLGAGELQRQLDYWQARLGDEHPALELPLDHPRPAVPSHRGERVEFALEGAWVERLRAFARQRNLTPFMLLLGAFKLLLHRYSGQADIRVGVPIANRNRAEVEGLIGFFVNTQVLSTQLDPTRTVEAFLQDVRDTALGAQSHQELPFEQLVEALKLERSLSRNPLFQAMYNHQPEVRAVDALATRSGLRLGRLAGETRVTQFDLTLDTYERDGDLHAALTYASDLFDAATVRRMANHWRNLVQAMVSHPERPLGELDMLDPQERRTLLDTWNDSEPLAEPETLGRLFEARVQRTPDALALIVGEAHYTYAELNRRANRLAHRLIALGVAPGARVGVALPRTVDLPVALLAVLKAGGAYVPLDPDYPAERVAYMLADSGAGVLLSVSALRSRWPASEARVLCLDEPDAAQASAELDPPARARPEDLAYLIYTSGSTGKPKGVAIEHRNATALVDWARRHYTREDLSGVLAATSVCFDLSVWEFFVTFCRGGFAVLADNALALPSLPARDRVRLINTVPSAIAALLRADGIPASVRIVNLAGEALKQSLVDALYQVPGIQRVHDLYGPSEDTTYSTFALREAGGMPNIGRPLDGTRAYILDGGGQPVPVGVAGELYLGGAGLARGYFDRPALTAEKFLPDPFGPAGGRLYRTGDLARYLPDGRIDYVGRIDHQVKVRGFRIELGEIEARLLAHPRVQEAAVLARDTGQGAQLVAYVALGETAGDDALLAELREHLRQTLPDYMVPAHLLLLPRLPLTPNGKLDRKALPEPEQVARSDYQAPANAAEQALADIWQAVLGMARVGREDNFFELGGDSIVSLQIVSRAREAGLQLSPRDLFQHQTVASLAAAAGQGGAPSREQAPPQGELPLLPIQRHFFDLQVPQPHHWNQSVLLRSRVPLDGDRLAEALDAVLAHHDALRLSFFQDERGDWRARYRDWQPGVGVQSLWVREVAHAEAITAVCDAAQASLDLRQGPLLRAALIQAPDGQRLLLAIHHLAVDGVSWRVLLEDLQSAYQQRLAGRDVVLPPRSSSLQAWSQRLQAHAADPALRAELDYWRQQLADDLPELPRDHPGGSLAQRHARRLNLRLDRTQTERLLKQAPAAYRTQVNDLLLAALARVLCRWTEAPSVRIQLEGHGREAPFDDLDPSRTVGWFTALFPLRLTPADDLPGTLKAVKEQLRAVPSKGLGYGILRHLAEPETRQELAGLPEPRVTFNYLGQFDASFDAEALLRPAGESSGAGQSEDSEVLNWLAIDGQVYDGALSLDWTFSGDMYREATIQTLLDAYRDELLAVIEHCAAGGPRGATPSDFPLAGLSQDQLDSLPLPAAELADLYPLSPMQQGMLFHSLYEGEQDTYVNQLRVDVEGLDVARFEAAWQAGMARHDILRSGFVWLNDGAQPLQFVRRGLALPLECLDWRGQASEQALDAFAEADRQRGFDLARPPLLRLTLIRLDDTRYHLIHTSHHILMDGWSNAQLLGEILGRYAGDPEPPAPGAYRTYIAWLRGRDADAAKAFWRSQLAALEGPTQLAAALPRPAPEATGHGERQRLLDAATSARLAAFARQHKVTVNTLIQAAWLLLLQRYTGQRCVALGTTVSGRPAELPDIERQIGLFINTLPLIAAPRPTQTVSDWLQTVQALNLALREQEYTPLYDIQRWAGASGDALFDSILVFENFPVAQSLQRSDGAGLRFSAAANHERTNYPLTLTVHLGERLSLDYGYRRDRFTEHTMARLDDHLVTLLQGFVDSPEGCLGALRLTGEAETRTLLEAWSPLETAQALPCVHQAFEAQVARTPARVALKLDGEVLHYDALNRRANRLAHRLRERGVGPDVAVGVALERSLDLVVSLLAILKAGGAYVPLDPQYPAERLGWMMEDSGLRLLLSHSALVERLPVPAGVRCLCLDQEDLQAGADHDPAPLAQPRNLAYLMFTSGSTGRPKGVGIEHAALARHVQVITALFALQPEDCALQFGTFNFDAFVEQLYPALTCGASVLMRGPELWDSETFRRQVVEQGVSVIDVTTAYWYMLVRDVAERGPQDFGRLRQLHIGGEAMPPDGLQHWARAGLGHVRLLNTYGPTETTVSATALDCADYLAGREPLPATMPIGRPLDGRCVYLVDASLNPVPVGVTGELLIGGALLARGYFGRPGLSAERFLPDPFGAQPGGRLYRTGDLARYRADGLIEYVGRADHQVKIRGFRIELGEIEACLADHPDVREALVLALEQEGDKRLVAYWVPGASADHRDPAALRTALRAHLQAQLPDYMVPAQWVMLDAFPLGPNGKLDRTALPAPSEDAGDGAFAEPVGALEQRLADLWRRVLGISRVGRDDNFFALGGHSLLATRAVSLARAEGLEGVQLRDFFECRDLAAQAERIARQGATRVPADDGLPSLAPQPRLAPLPLSLAQQRLWLVDRISAPSAAYIMPAALDVRGPLALPTLAQAFERLLQRHEILRTAYRQNEEGDPEAVVAEWVELPLAFEDIADLPPAAREPARVDWLARCLAQRIDIETAPLLRVHVLRLGADHHQVCFAMHHIVSDGWSMGVLVNEVLAFYRACALQRPADLAPLPLQYLDYALWQQRRREAGGLEADTAFWRQRLAGAPARLALPTDQPRPSVPSLDGDSLEFRLDEPLYGRLKALARSLDTTPYLLLLASFQLLLHRACGGDDLVLGTDVAGRQQRELEGLIGFFVNVLPLRSRFDPAQPFSAYLERVQREALEAFEHQDLPLDLIVEACAVERIKGVNPLVQVLFVMDNTPSGTLEIEGLRLEPLPLQERHSKFEMGLFVEEVGNSLVCNWSYAVALFRRERIERLMHSWIGILEQTLRDRHTLLGEFVMAIAPESAAPEKAASNKFDKLNKFLKKGPVTAAKAAPSVRFTALREGHDFPLLAQPEGGDLNVIEWIAQNRPLLEEKLVTHACILFRGFGLRGIEEFEQFAEAVQPGLYGRYGDLPKKEGGKNTYRSTPYPEQKMILFHNESSHQDRWPRKQMFFCEQPSPKGGATPIVDCREMCRRLPQDVLQTFERKGLLYVRTFTEKLDVSWRHFFKTDSREEVEARCRAAGIDWRWLEDDELQTRTYCPAVISHPLTGERSFFNQVQLHHIQCLDPDVRDDLIGLFGLDNMPRHVYYGDGTPIPDAVMETVGRVYEECAVRFDWQKGDVVLLDNMLAAHARDPYEGPRKIVVAMGDMYDRSALEQAPAARPASALATEVEL
ncbi:non-ribosomal peptide synthetase [Pseudomonas mangiferae]|uniref:Amino acid adenylation domain-containing protein n=1 Tax=Pseudomonas mangiferae TaxID=2593654 RepID=A0A553H500_9PSED|nr:non-ribosomal peptide synthetase [Pseudomonas mangiferae]TRX76806.1 amino acid adenylation domain-containing protein [Pseudomonas mangiferae]